MMNEAKATSELPYSPLWWWLPWMMPQAGNAQVGPLAPQSLTQPIQPGWAFGNVITVTERNSSSPETEREIVSEESYGRQLGRVIDAVTVLIQERPKNLPKKKAFDDLLELSNTIEKIKSRSVASRLKRVEADLVRLKAERPEDYRRIASTMADELQRPVAVRTTGRGT
jgi:hypothetical protein